ncbi:MAG: sigma 54-interacting transcriptional regulator, partial [Pseudomonadota bacterium]|nr:sigma 54-interacting transcriptional regulator [Pseudomonadota bacterium]
MLGYSRDDLLDTPISHIHRDQLPRMVSFVESVLIQGHGWTEELACITKSGDKIAAEISASVVHAGENRCVIALVRDISARKKIESSLREQGERLANVLDSAMDAIVTIDEEQRITLFNQSAEHVFRYSAATAVGRSFNAFLCPISRQFLVEHLRTVNQRGNKERHLWAPQGLCGRRADGEEFPIDLTVSCLEEHGQILYTIILRDLNDRRHAEERLMQLQQENRYLQEEVKTQYDSTAFIGTSPSVQAILRKVSKVAPTDSAVLLYGETGTGKELLATAIHSASMRHDKLLVNVNCAALPAGLIESELFGYEKGAFTGATARKKGRFELANGGTIFLDEVGELPAEAQAKLLRVLQEKEFERLGGTETIRSDVRVIAATNINLPDAVKAGHFRSDLFYRLSVFPLTLPPLRERKPDIPILAQHFLAKFSKKLNKPVSDFSASSMDRLTRYSWPGNVRELQNVVERAIILSSGTLLEIDDAIGFRLGAAVPSSTPRTLAEAQRAHILQVLEETDWIVEGDRGAATILDVHP